MICFPNAKINIGLHITEKRQDGYHNIETIFYPIHGLCDCLEFLESSELIFENEGIQIDTPLEKNICVKAWNTFKSHFNIPPIHIILYKNIPFGGGLGGGSADAAFMLSALNSYFSVGATTEQLEQMALELGSDCPYFIHNKPMFAEGRGELLKPIQLSLKGYWILLAKPNIAVSTAKAYEGIVPVKPEKKLIEVLPQNPKEWNGIVQNDFERTIFAAHPEIGQLKETMYQLGAVYASMSGSGATVYGIFDKEITVPKTIPTVWFGLIQ